MGKWETNIGNVIKNNSGGRVVIEENGVRYNKKVSVVRQVVNGIVKQVWNAYNFPSVNNIDISRTGSITYIRLCENTDYIEAKNRGATKIKYKFTITNYGGGNRYALYDCLVSAYGGNETTGYLNYEFFRQNLSTTGSAVNSYTFEGERNINVGGWADTRAGQMGVEIMTYIKDDRGAGDGQYSVHIDYIGFSN